MMRRNPAYLNSPLKPDRFSSQPKYLPQCMNQAPRIPIPSRSPINLKKPLHSHRRNPPRDKPLVLIRREPDVPCRFLPNQPPITNCTQLRQQRRSSPKTRRIKFARYDDVYLIPSITDYSKKEMKATWMTRSDFKAIRMECRTAVKALDGQREDGKELPEGYYLRGLDQQTMVYNERSDVIIRKVHDAVFRIQQFQRENPSKVMDASLLMAKVSAKYSEPAVVAAQMAAISDLFAAFKGTWTKRSIPTIKDMPTKCNVTLWTM